MKTMKSISQKAAALLVAAGVFSGAHAVEDLPGGPAVRQLNLQTAATRIAVEQSWLHWMMLIACLVIFIAVFAGIVVRTLRRRPSTFEGVAALPLEDGKEGSL